MKCILIYKKSLLLQVTNSKANCAIMSVLSQVQGVPDDYSATYMRGWMVIHMARNSQKYAVGLTMNIHSNNYCTHHLSILPYTYISLYSINHVSIYIN